MRSVEPASKAVSTGRTEALWSQPVQLPANGPSPGLRRQTDIFTRGLGGVQPLTADLERLQRQAHFRMLLRGLSRSGSIYGWDVVSGGAGQEKGLQANLAAFDRWGTIQRG